MPLNKPTNHKSYKRKERTKVKEREGERMWDKAKQDKRERKREREIKGEREKERGREREGGRDLVLLMYQWHIILSIISSSWNNCFSHVKIFYVYYDSAVQRFNHYITWTPLGTYQMLPLQARVDLGAMAMKGCSAFPKAPALLKPHHQII